MHKGFSLTAFKVMPFETHLPFRLKRQSALQAIFSALLSLCGAKSGVLSKSFAVVSGTVFVLSSLNDEQITLPSTKISFALQVKRSL